MQKNFTSGARLGIIGGAGYIAGGVMAIIIKAWLLSDPAYGTYMERSYSIPLFGALITEIVVGFILSIVAIGILRTKDKAILKRPIYRFLLVFLISIIVVIVCGLLDEDSSFKVVLFVMLPYLANGLSLGNLLDSWNSFEKQKSP